MKHVEMQRGNEVVRGWIEDRGAHVGKMVEVKGAGEEKFRVITASIFSLDEAEVKERADAARKPFTALKSYRGNK